MRVALVILLAGSLVLHTATTRADEITDQLDQARAYYGQGDVTGAIGELEFVLQALKSKIGEQLLATFPEPPAGWTVEAGEQPQAAMPFAAAGTMLSRTYRSAAGDGSRMPSGPSISLSFGDQARKASDLPRAITAGSASRAPCAASIRIRGAGSTSLRIGE